MENEIRELELRLKKAMLKSDIAVLDKLLSPDLVFINHLGQTMTKQDDLNLHQSGILSISSIEILNQHIRTFNKVAIVTLETYLVGTFKDIESKKRFQFTRVWSKNEQNDWQIVTVHSCLVL